MTSRNSAELGSRHVKLDYSETYRDNDNLDDTLSSQIESLHKVHFRANREKDVEIEAIRKDADKILTLKDVVNQRDTNKEISNIFSKPKDSEEHNGFSSSETSRVNRRLQKEREKFSAKNHFNVVLPKWNPLSDINDRKQYMPVSVPVSKPLVANAPGDNKGQIRSKNYMQMTSSSRHRLARPRSVPVTTMSSSRPYMNGAVRSQSATRSRRELEELSRIELSLSEPKVYTPSEQRQNILLDLRSRQKNLQIRVSSFVTELERFNKRSKRNLLAKYLDT